MVDVNVDFILGSDEPIGADFELEPDVTYTADIILSSFSSLHDKLFNRDLPDQHPMSAITGLESALSGLGDDITDEVNRATNAEGALSRAIADEETRAKGVEEDLASSIDSNHQAISDHVSNKNNPHEVTKAQVGLGNVENIAPADMPISTATQTALGGKVDKTNVADKVYGTDSSGNQTTYNVDSFGKVDDVKVAGTSVVTNKVANLGSMASETASDYSTKAVADTLYAGISYEGTIDNHIADKNNPHAVTKTQVGLGNCDNTSDLDKPISTATQTALNGKQDTISDLSTIRENATHGESAYNTISGYGDIVTHNTSEFATSAQGTLADTALQPNDNISELNNDVGYITSSAIPTNYVTTDTAQTITGTKTFHNCAIESDNFITLTSPNAYVRYSGSGVVRSLLRRNSSGTVEIGSSNDPVKIQGSATRPTYNSSDLALYTDVTSGDSALQSQINDLKSRGHFLALWNCATGLAETNPPQSPYTYQAGDFFIVGVVSTANPPVNYMPDGSSYTTGVASTTVESGTVDVDDTYYYDGTTWKLQINTEKTTAFVNIAGSPYDNTNLATALNAKADSASLANVATTGDYDDLLNKPTIPTVNDATLTIQQNGTDVATFTANSATNQTANITVPTDTNDLSNGAGYITGITSSDVTTALGYTPYNSTNPDGFISGITSGDVTTALGYTPVDPANLGTMATESASDYTPTSGLAAVAISGDYDDLLNKPTIPTVDQTYDGTSSNPQSGVAIAGAGFITGITSGDVTTALGYTPYDATNPSGYISGITSGDVTTALGYTPYNSTNPSGYISSASVSSLTDVTLSSVANGDVLIYNSTSQKWENGSVPTPTVDQTYDPTSANAQSGTAIAGAGFLTSADVTSSVTFGSSSPISSGGVYSGTTLVTFRRW